MISRCLGAHCAPLRDNIANGNISLQTPVQVDFAIEQSVLPFGSGACDCLVQSHNRTATRLPARSVVDSLCCGKATVVETAHWAVSKSHLSNPQSPSAKTEKGHSFWNVLLFWWKVVDSNHRSHRRQIYSLFPLATRETFHIRLPA